MAQEVLPNWKRVTSCRPHWWQPAIKATPLCLPVGLGCKLLRLGDFAKCFYGLHSGTLPCPGISLRKPALTGSSDRPGKVPPVVRKEAGEPPAGAPVLRGQRGKAASEASKKCPPSSCQAMLAKVPSSMRLAHQPFIGGQSLSPLLMSDAQAQVIGTMRLRALFPSTSSRDTSSMGPEHGRSWKQSTQWRDDGQKKGLQEDCWPLGSRQHLHEGGGGLCDGRSPLPYSAWRPGSGRGKGVSPAPGSVLRGAWAPGPGESPPKLHCGRKGNDREATPASSSREMLRACSTTSSSSSPGWPDPEGKVDLRV